MGVSNGSLPGSLVSLRVAVPTGASLKGNPNLLRTAGCWRVNCCKIDIKISYSKYAIKPPKSTKKTTTIEYTFFFFFFFFLREREEKEKAHYWKFHRLYNSFKIPGSWAFGNDGLRKSIQADHFGNKLGNNHLSHK